MHNPLGYQFHLHRRWSMSVVFCEPFFSASCHSLWIMLGSAMEFCRRIQLFLWPTTGNLQYTLQYSSPDASTALARNRWTSLRCATVILNLRIYHLSRGITTAGQMVACVVNTEVSLAKILGNMAMTRHDPHALRSQSQAPPIGEFTFTRCFAAQPDTKVRVNSSPFLESFPLFMYYAFIHSFSN